VAFVIDKVVDILSTVIRLIVLVIQGVNIQVKIAPFDSRIDDFN
jgi:hypothetical protein